MAKVRRLPARVIRSRTSRHGQDLLGEMVGGHGRSFLLDRAKHPASRWPLPSSQIGPRSSAPSSPRTCPLRQLGTFREAADPDGLTGRHAATRFLRKIVSTTYSISTRCSELAELTPTRRHVSRPRCGTPMQRVPSQNSAYRTTMFRDCSRCSAAWRRTVRRCHILLRNRRGHVS